MSKKTIQSFDSLGLNPEILKALEELNFETPTPIQEQAIPVILNSSNDLLGFAQTGTGKTAAFALPIIQGIEPKKKHVQAIILCPTRELCVQITRDISSFSKYLPHTNAVAIYGGSSMYQQIKTLDKGVQIVVGTPGRVKDLINRGKLKINKVNWLVLDEADDMLDKGFKEDLDTILDDTPDEKQTLLFSATMSPWIQKVAQKRMHNPKEIKVAAKNQGAENVEHKYVTVHARDRYEALRRLLDVNPDVYGIVFCRTRRDTKTVASKLIADNYSAEAIHGDIAQNERSEAMSRFRDKQIKILVATDVAARGIDVNDLTHVINYELPDNAENYVHRSGRTGRAGKDGVSITIINMKERGKIRRIAKMMKKDFSEIDVPKGKDICEAQLLSLVHKVKDSELDHDNLDPYLPAIYSELEGLSKEEVIQHFVSVEFNRFLQYYSNIKDISTLRGKRYEKDRSYDRSYDRGRGRGRDRNKKKYGANKERGKNMEMGIYKINFGRKDGFNPKSLFTMINNNQSLRGIEIGDIDVQSSSTKFEADKSYDKKILRFLGSEKYRKKNVKLKRV